MSDGRDEDARQRSASRRQLERIGMICVVGLFFIALSAVSDLLGIDGDGGYRSYSNAWGYLIGGVCIASGLHELGRRLVLGPPRPGKRARH